MRQFALTISLAVLTAGCNDALRDVPRLSEVELAESTGEAEVRAAPDGGAAKPAPAIAEDDRPRDGVLGALNREAEAARAAPQAPDGLFAGLFGGRAAATAPEPGAPDYREIAPGETLPFGEMARVCALPEAALGTPIEQAGGYVLHDSAPGTAAPRALYVTGFGDGCPRQVTGALALFGSPEMHEELRYGAPSKTLPYSTADEAYEQVKSLVCRVARGTPCGRSLRKLEKDTVFVTVYARMGGSEYRNMLLHDGRVLAFDGG